MEPQTITVALVGLICIILGAAASGLIYTLREEQESGAGSAEPTSPPGGNAGLYTVEARLWREHSSGSLVVEVDGKAFTDAEALGEARKAALAQLGGELLNWSGGKPAPAATPPVRMEGAFASAAPVRRGGNAVILEANEDENGETTEKSIVSQIEDILQARIAGSPLERRGVHLHEDPAHGVIVTVGVDRYAGIDQVPDAEVQGEIRAAVAEWETNQS